MKFFKHVVLLYLILCVNQCFCDYKYQNITVTCEISDDDTSPLKFLNRAHLGDTNIIHNICNDGSHYDYPHLTIQGKIPVLDENSISNLTIEIWTLNISNVGLEQLNPGSFKNMSYLFTLDLQNNKLKVIRKGVFDRISIIFVLLGNNDILEIEANAFFLPKSWWRQYLVLDSNKLEKIDSDVFNNTHRIVHLNLANNSIKKVRPGDFKIFPELEFLDLSRNFIKEIPNGVFNGSRLRTLKLDNNEISTIESAAFRNLNNLKLFSIRHNKLKKWNSDWFRRIREMTHELTLLISYNEIEEIPANAFIYPSDEYSRIELDGNSIKKISDASFSGLHRIHLLNLSYNHLEQWNKNWLKHLNKYNVNMDIHQVDLTFNTLLCQEENSTSIVPQADEVFIEKCNLTKNN